MIVGMIFEERRLERRLMMVVEERKVRGAGQPYICDGTPKIGSEVAATNNEFDRKLHCHAFKLEASFQS